MKHRIIILVLGLLIVGAIVGGVVYWEWPEIPGGHEMTPAPPPSAENHEGATTSLLDSLPRPVVGPRPAEAAPPIAWTPSSINEVVGQGQTKTITASFVSSENLTNVVVRVVPELQPYVQVSPSSFSSIAKGQTVLLNITLSVSDNAPLGTATGTIQLRTGRGTPGTLARPLPVTIDVWRAAVNENAGYSIAVPPNMIAVLSTDPASPELGLYASSAALSTGILPLAVVRVDTLPDESTLRSWIMSFGLGGDDKIVEVVLGGRTYLRWIEDAGEHFATVSYSTLVDDQIITFTSRSEEFGTGSVFMNLIGSLVLQ
jgi:hypothetical protein